MKWSWQCNYLIELKRPDGFKQLVPCGHCLPCSKKRQMAWALRICLERSLHECASFVTLTYTDDIRPGALDYGHIERFMKRLRRNSPAPVRFFCVGEYGKRTEREHWHLALFGVPPFPMAAQLIGQCWPNGHIHVGELNQASAAYIGRYSLKTGVQGEKFVMNASRRPGIGLTRAEQIGSYLASLQPKLARLPSCWRLGGTLIALDRSTSDAVQRGYALGGGRLMGEQRTRLGYDLDAKLYAFLGDPFSAQNVRALESIERVELERGTF